MLLLTEMSGKKVQWGDDQTKALQGLFVDGTADPLNQSNNYIDDVYELALGHSKAFDDIPVERFRYHYKAKSQLWLTDQAVAGNRRSSSSSESFFNLMFAFYLTLTFCFALNSCLQKAPRKTRTTHQLERLQQGHQRNV